MFHDSRREFDAGILREYDIRGIVGHSLDAAVMQALGAAFAERVLAAGGSMVAVGRDGRLSSPMLEAALCQGLASRGVAVRRIGTGPTPMLYFAGQHLQADGAIMVTGSHNPPDHNGLKMVLQGRPFFGQAIKALGADAAQRLGQPLPAGMLQDRPGRLEPVAVEAAYLAAMLADLHIARPLNVVWDPGNGAAGAVLPALIERLPGRHVLINATVDGRFPAHHPDPTVPANMEQLRAAVLAERADLGIAFDGDGDRIGIIDERGRILWGDQYVALLARQVLAARPGATILVDIKTSDLVVEEVERLGGRPLIWKTGHSLIKTKMKEVDAPFAGEMSGHIFFADRYFGFDDGLYAALRFLEFVSQQADSVAALSDALPKRVSTPETRIDCADADKFRIVETLQALLRQDGRRFLDIDGARVITDGGWWLVRASNTQPILVTRAEAASAAALRQVERERTEWLARAFARLALPLPQVSPSH